MTCYSWHVTLLLLLLTFHSWHITLYLSVSGLDSFIWSPHSQLHSWLVTLYMELYSCHFFYVPIDISFCLSLITFYYWLVTLDATLDLSLLTFTLNLSWDLTWPYGTFLNHWFSNCEIFRNFNLLLNNSLTDSLTLTRPRGAFTPKNTYMRV